MEFSEFQEVSVEVTRGVASVVLNRPDRRNAWSGRMAAEYRWALHHAHERADVRVVVVSGAGGDFCVGADSAVLDAISGDEGRYERADLPLPPFPDGTPAPIRHNHAYPIAIRTPVIAALTGACAGAGFVVASFADLRFAATDSRITTSFAKLGLPAEYGLGWLLPRLIGIPAALELLYTARVLNGMEALQIGLVQRCEDPDLVVPRALEFAYELARGSSPESMRMMKRQVFIDAALDLGSAYERSVEDMNQALKHPDIREGIAALKERRPTNFLGPQPTTASASAAGHDQPPTARGAQ